MVEGNSFSLVLLSVVKIFFPEDGPAPLPFISSWEDESLICSVNLGIPGHAQFSMGLDSALWFGNFPLVFAAPGLGFPCMHFWC